MTLHTNPAFFACSTKEPAFESLGVTYWKHTQDGFSMAYAKYQEAVDMADFHHRYRLTAEDVDIHENLVYDLATNANLSEADRLTEIARLTALHKERRRWEDPHVKFMEAALCFFDESEDPEVFDSRYARVKIDRWLSDPDLVKKKGFFSQPVSNWLPVEALSASSTAEEMMEQVQRAIHSLRQGGLFGLLYGKVAHQVNSLTATDDEKASILSSRLVTLAKLDSFVGSLSPNTLISGAYSLSNDE